MKIIADTQVAALDMKTRFGDDSQSNELKRMLVNLNVGEAIEVSKAEWTGAKTGPGGGVNYWSKQFKGTRKFTTRQLQRNKGWVIIRKK